MEDEPLSRAAKRHKEREARRQEAQEEEDGGYSLLPRGVHRAEGGVAATGDERTCLADAMAVIMSTLKQQPLTPHLTKKVRSWFVERCVDGQDPHQRDAMQFAKEHEFVLTHVCNTSPRILVNLHEGIYLVRLLIHYKDEGETKTDMHFVVYDALNAKIIDNARGQPVIKIDENDRKDNKSAMSPYYKELFPLATKIQMTSVCRATY